jgi:hypothetical protein
MLISHPQASDAGMLSSNEAGTPPAFVMPPALVAALREPAILIAAAEWTLARDLLAVPVLLLPLEQDAELGLVAHIDGQRVPMPALPPLSLAAIAFTDAGEASLQAAIDAAPGADAAPLVTRMEPGDAMALAIAVVAGSTGMLQRQASQLAASLRSLGQMRIAHEDHQQRLAALEAFIARDNQQDFDCVFAEQPAAGEDAALRLGSDANLRRIEQLLPVASRGVSAIALHLAPTPFSPDAVVHIRLTSLEDRVLRAEWRMPVRDLVPGWQVLGLDRAITGLSRTLRLSVEVSGGTLAFSMGGRQPLAGFRVTGEDGVAVAPRSLAFKVWSGLPGVMPPVTEVDRLAGAEDLGQGFEQVALAIDAIALTRDGTTTTRLADEDDSLPCDPARQGIALGRLPGALPAGTLMVQAEGRVSGAEAVEFALAAADSPEAARALAHVEGPVAGWSGWVASAADGTAPLHLFLAETGGEAQDLYVLTRRLGTGALPRARLARLGATVAAARLGGREPAPALEAAETPPAAVLVPARDFTGTGFHALEGAGENAWRWLGAEVALRLPNVPRRARSITLRITATAPGLAEGALSASVNSMPATARFETTADGALAAVVAIPEAARRRDRRVVLDLGFGRAHQPPGDGRVLSAACTGLTIDS